MRKKKKTRQTGGTVAFVLAICFLCVVLIVVCREKRPTDTSEAFSSGGMPSAAESRPADASIPSVDVQLLPLEGKTVVLDPGHGFGDVGCAFPFREGLYEKDITPILAEKIREELESLGATVLMTHDGRSFPSLSELRARSDAVGYQLERKLRDYIATYSGRTPDGVEESLRFFLNGITDNDLFSVYERSWYANLLSEESGADLYLAVHVNANPVSEQLRGFEVYSCGDTPFAERSERMLFCLERSFRKAFPDRTVKKQVYSWDDAFVVNKYPMMPSVLIEAGYATNREDARLLQEEAWQRAFAKAVAAAVSGFFGK